MAPSGQGSWITQRGCERAPTETGGSVDDRGRARRTPGRLRHSSRWADRTRPSHRRARAFSAPRAGYRRRAVGRGENWTAGPSRNLISSSFKEVDRCVVRCCLWPCPPSSCRRSMPSICWCRWTRRRNRPSEGVRPRTGRSLKATPRNGCSYRGGSFLLLTATHRREAHSRGGDGTGRCFPRQQIRGRSGGQHGEHRPGKAPNIAVLLNTPPDDAVTLALTCADIPYDRCGTPRSGPPQGDWLHLHEVTGQLEVLHQRRRGVAAGGVERNPWRRWLPRRARVERLRNPPYVADGVLFTCAVRRRRAHRRVGVGIAASFSDRTPRTRPRKMQWGRPWPSGRGGAAVDGRAGDSMDTRSIPWRRPWAFTLMASSARSSFPSMLVNPRTSTA